MNRLALLCLILCAAASAQAQIKISQVYGGGGNSGAVYKNDFIELFNAGGATVTMTNWSVQYASSTGTSWQVTAVSGTLAPGQYFLVQEAAGSGGTTSLPTPDATGSINMSGTTGKVALVNNTTALTGACPTGLVDFVGFGGANCYEGAGPTAVLSNTTAAIRAGGGCTDTNNNAADFAVAAPTPRNSASATAACSAAPTAVGSATPSTVVAGAGTTFGATVTPGFNPASVSYTVACNLSGIGGSSTQAFTGSGTTFSYAYTVPAATGATGYSLPCTVTDEQSRSSAFNIALTVTGSSTNPSATGASSPTPVTAGNSLALTAAVTPGTGPTSTGIAVACNTTALGGTAATSLLWDGTQYSGSITVAVATSAGPYTIGCTVSDAQLRSASFNIAATVVAPLPALVPISSVNGPGLASPYANQAVTVRGIVTARRASNGFYLQSLPADVDADPATSEGLLVYGSIPACAVVGNAIQISGTVSDYVPTASGSAVPAGSLPLTELGSTHDCSILSSGNALPAALNLTASILDPASNGTTLRRYVGMLVSIPSATVSAGSLGTLTEASATAVPSGTYWVTLPGVARGLRTQGILATRRPADAASSVPSYNGSPEVIRIVSNGLAGGRAVETAPGVAVTGISGVMDFSTSDGQFQVYTAGTEVLTPNTPALSVTPVPARLPNDLVIANANLQHFYNDVSKSANPNESSALALTTAAYQGRLNKLSLAVRNVMGMPDIISFEEIETPTSGNYFPVIQDIMNKLNADAAANGQSVNYNWCTYPTNDVSYIGIAFLFNTNRVSLVDCVQYGAAATYTTPGGGTSTLHDRPSVALRVNAKAPGSDSGIQLRVLANHPKAILGVDEPGVANGDRVRAKRNEQAKYIAHLIMGSSPDNSTNWNANENLLVVGDFNSYQFNDGYIDVLGCIAGTPAAVSAQYTTAAQVAVSPLCTTITTPALTNLTNLDPANRYSYSYSGARQTIDHMLANNNVLPRVRQYTIAHLNADYPEGPTYRNATTRPERYSDHDAPVLFLTLPVEVTSAVKVTVAPGTFNRGSGRTTSYVTIMNTGATTLAGPLYVFFNSLTGATLPELPSSGGAPYVTIQIPAGLAPGATSAAVSISFSNPGNTKFLYTNKVFNGSF